LDLEISNMACIDHQGHNEIKCKIRSKGIGKGSRDLLEKFWDSLSQEQ